MARCKQSSLKAWNKSTHFKGANSSRCVPKALSTIQFDGLINKLEQDLLLGVVIVEVEPDCRGSSSRHGGMHDP